MVDHRSKVPDGALKDGFLYHDYKFAGRRCVSRAQLQPADMHKERMIKIKEI